MPKIVDHDSRRDALAEAVWQVICTFGVEGATVRRISEASGWSAGVLSHYFKNKDELLRAALELARRRTRERGLRKAEGLDGFDALQAVLLESLPLDSQRRIEMHVEVSFWDRMAANEDLAGSKASGFDGWRARVTELVRRAQTVGELVDDAEPEEIADQLVALVDGLGVEGLLYPASHSPERIGEIVDNALERWKPALDVLHRP